MHLLSQPCLSGSAFAVLSVALSHAAFEHAWYHARVRAIQQNERSHDVSGVRFSGSDHGVGGRRRGGTARGARAVGAALPGSLGSGAAAMETAGTSEGLADGEEGL